MSIACSNAGFEIQNAPKDYLIIDQTVHYHNEEKKVDIVALPTDDFRITVMVDYNNPALGSQHTGLFNLEKEFITEFAPCRTFCFLHEVEMLHSQGLIRGGNLDNAIVIVDRELDDAEIKTHLQQAGHRRGGDPRQQRRCEQPPAAFPERAGTPQAARRAWAISR